MTNLTNTEIAVLNVIAAELREGEEQGFVTSAEVAKSLDITPRGAGSVLGHLFRKGLVSDGHEAPDNKSALTFRLTEAGITAADQGATKAAESLAEKNVDKVVQAANKAIKSEAKKKAAKVWIAKFDSMDDQEFSADNLVLQLPVVGERSFDTLKTAKIVVRQNGGKVAAAK